jgi:hypothetical protein
MEKTAATAIPCRVLKGFRARQAQLGQWVLLEFVALMAKMGKMGIKALRV